MTAHDVRVRSTRCWVSAGYCWEWVCSCGERSAHTGKAAAHDWAAQHIANPPTTVGDVA